VALTLAVVAEFRGVRPPACGGDVVAACLFRAEQACAFSGGVKVARTDRRMVRVEGESNATSSDN